MEDPWGGPSWGASTSSPPSPPPLSPPRATLPPSTTTYDPWATPPPASSQDDGFQGVRGMEMPVEKPSSSWEDDAMGGWGQPTPRAAPVDSPNLAEPADISLPMSPVDEPDPGAGAWNLDSPPETSDSPPVVPDSPPEASYVSPEASYTPPEASDLPSTAVDREASPHESPFASPSRQSPAFSPRLDFSHIPKSTSFPEDGFGGFASIDAGGDPWGAKEKWGSPTLSLPASPAPDQAEDEGAGWGGVRPPRGIDSPTVQGESDWERAQVEMRIKEERAPQEKILHLRKQWEEVAPSGSIPKLTEEEDQALRDRVRLLETKTGEAIRDMSTIPSEINIYPPIISSLTIHERHVYAVTRPNPLPATSLLHSAPRVSTTARLAEAGSDAWFGRSRLGEEVTPVEAPAEQEEKKGWFWQRSKAPEKPLVTSGGGVLERAPSATAQVSRAASPASTAASTRPSEDLAPATLPSVTATAPAPPKPRKAGFWGRFARQPSATADPNDKDLELSNDDFSFLDQVPSTVPPQSNVADLLFMEGDGHSASKDTTIVDPIPPISRSSEAPAPAVGRFVPRMINTRQPPSRKASDMDLLVSFGEGDTSHPPAKGASQVAFGDWDALLSGASTAPTPGRSTPGTHTPPALQPPTPTALQGSFMGPVPASQSFGGERERPPAPTSRPSTQEVVNLDDDFGDFGDFSAFDAGQTLRPKNSILPPPQPPLPSASTPHHPPTVRPPPLPAKMVASPRPLHIPLDHTPAANLMTNVASTKGQRWPAPASPAAPAIAPPNAQSTFNFAVPTPHQSAGAIPFLPPPPGGARSASSTGSRSGNLLDTDDSTPPVDSKSVFVSRITQSTASTPTGTAPKPSGTSQGGLTAQDLSFFDSL